MKRTLFTGALALGLATAAGASGIGNYDAFWAQHDNTSIAAQAASPHYESALRGSTFLWADRSALAPTVGNIGKPRRPAPESFSRQSLRLQAGWPASYPTSVHQQLLIYLTDLGIDPDITLFHNPIASPVAFHR